MAAGAGAGLYHCGSSLRVKADMLGVAVGQGDRMIRAEKDAHKRGEKARDE